MFANIAAVGAATALLLGGSTMVPITEQAAPRPPGAVSVKTVKGFGSACTRGAAITAQVMKDSSAFTIRQPAFTARAGGTATFFDRMKFCQVQLDLKVPPGWTYTLASAEYGGRAALAGGASGTVRFSYYWTAGKQTATHQKSLTQRDTAWKASDTAGLKKLGWRPCGAGASLNVKTEVMVDPGSSKGRTSTVTVGSPGTASATYRVFWKKC